MECGHAFEGGVGIAGGGGGAHAEILYRIDVKGNQNLLSSYPHCKIQKIWIKSVKFWSKLSKK